MNTRKLHPGCPSLSAVLLGIAMLAVGGCQPQGPLLIVQVTPVLAGADTLQVMTVLGEIDPKTAQEVPEFSIDGSSGKQYFSFALRLPDGAGGKATIAVAAVNKQTGCLLATGVVQTFASVTASPDTGAVTDVTLTPLAMPDCGQGLRRPRLLSIAGAANPVTASSGDSLMVTGWGFQPGIAVSLAGHPAATVTWISPLQLGITVPSLLGMLGPVALSVVNPDAAQGMDQRSDLISYFQKPTFAAASADYVCTDSMNAALAKLVSAQLDGKPGQDLVLGLSNVTRYYQVCVYLAAGDGTLSAGTSYATLASSGEIMIGDFDGKNGNDIAFPGSDQSSAKVTMLTNNGDGTFANLSNGISYNLGLASFTVIDSAAADLNNDKFMDVVLIVSSSSAPIGTYVYTLVNNKAGGFIANKALTLSTHDSYEFAVGDLNGDQLPDLAFTYADNRTIAGSTVSVPVAAADVFLNLGNSMFGSAATYPSYPTTNDDPISISAVDLDSDGKLDLLLTNGYLSNNGAGIFKMGMSYGYGYPQGAFNINGDQANDAVFDGGYTLNTIQPGISWLPLAMAPLPLAGFSGAELTDVNGDSLADIVTLQQNLTRFNVILNTTK